MANKKMLVLTISILMALSIPIIIYGFSFNLVAFNENYYKKEFSKYDVYANLENYDVESVNNNVMNYLKSGKNSSLIENDFFNEREKAHLLDVKNLIGKTLAIYYFSIILFFLFFILLVILMDFKIGKIVKKLLIIMIIGSLLTFLDGVLFFILSNLKFNFIFDLFHNTFFSSGTYLFNPEFENIVVLYPENLFFSLLIMIVTAAIFSSIILLFFSAIALFIFYRQNFPKIFRKFPTERAKKQKL